MISYAFHLSVASFQINDLGQYMKIKTHVHIHFKLSRLNNSTILYKIIFHGAPSVQWKCSSQTLFQ